MHSAAQTWMRLSARSIPRTRERLAWASSLLLVGLTAAAMAAWASRPTSVPLETTRTILSVAPTGETSGANPLEQRAGGARPTRTAVALSPDGKTLVFSAIWGGTQQLYARRMDQLSATPISGTSGGYSPFFSPDGQWVGFWRGWRAQEGSSQRRTGGHAVQGRGALRGELGRRRHHRVCDTAERGLMARACDGRHSRSAHHRSARRVQPPAAPHAARRPRGDLHGPERAESLERRADCRAVARRQAPRPFSSPEDRTAAMSPRDT